MSVYLRTYHLPAAVYLFTRQPSSCSCLFIYAPTIFMQLSIYLPIYHLHAAACLFAHPASFTLLQQFKFLVINLLDHHPPTEFFHPSSHFTFSLFTHLYISIGGEVAH